MQRTLLYVTPYFPPASKVGALRPLKFLRHLGGHGFRTVVLADLKRGDATNPALWDALPDDVEVHFSYTPRADRRFRSALLEPPDDAPEPRPRTGPKPDATAHPGLQPPSWLRWSPEYVPLGEHGPEIPGAIRAARRLLRERPADVILVNADPYAAMIVGDRVGARAGIPVVHDLRDPWSQCDLRRPNRPGPQRAFVDSLERRVVTRCARLVLNSETALAAYRAHYSDVDPERFTFIRNHGDPELIAAPSRIAREPDAPFTILFLGNFRRFLQGDALLGGLAALRARGHGPEEVRLAVTGNVTAEARAHAAGLGVSDMVEQRPFVPYQEIGAAMDAADLLIANIPSPMRIPAKLYDYAMSRRPILALGDADHHELRELAAGLPGTRFAASDDAEGVADAMASAFAEGRGVDVPRPDTGLDSATATARLAEVLHAAIDGR